MEKRYQVFVSSTYADLQQERRKVIQALMEMDCIPAGMELFPAADEEQWEFIKKVIDDCDYYILIIGGRYGTLTTEGVSYTEKEYDYAILRGLKVLGFVHQEPDEIPVAKSDIDPTLRAKLHAFRQKVCANRLVKFWREATELPGLVALSLTKTIKIYPAVGWTRAVNIVSDEVLMDLNNLRKENAQLKEFVREYEARNLVPDEKIAGLDDAVTVTVRWTEYKSGYGERKHSEKITTNWNELFALVAPELQGCPHDDFVENFLGQTLFSKAFQNSKAVKIDHQDFLTVRVQLSALGLVVVSYVKNTAGGMGLFWYLTPAGERLMLDLRTIKKKTDL